MYFKYIYNILLIYYGFFSVEQLDQRDHQQHTAAYEYGLPTSSRIKAMSARFEDHSRRNR